MQGVLKISEGSNLAIHALGYLSALPDGRAASVTKMAGALRVSKDHLDKVMQRLNRQDVVSSKRGPKGGFSLARRPADVTLLEVVELMDGPMAAPGCLLGRPVCRPGSCTLNGLAQKIHRQVRDVLATTTLADLPPPVTVD